MYYFEVVYVCVVSRSMVVVFGFWVFGFWVFGFWVFGCSLESREFSSVLPVCQFARGFGVGFKLFEHSNHEVRTV